MEKCVFIGYPDGYKGWKFYNPTTKKIIISECAEFDERYFLLKCNSVSSPDLNPIPEPLQAPQNAQPPVVGGDDDDDTPLVVVPPAAALPEPLPQEPDVPPAPEKKTIGS